MARFRAPVTHISIVINVLVYLAWDFASDLQPMADHFLVSWDGLSQGRVWTLLTSVFSHNMFLHILLNMFALNSFGPIVEETLGSKGFFVFYIIAGIVSSLTHAIVSAWLIGDSSLSALGASGSIAGLILLFSLLYPRFKILLFAIIPVPAFVGALLFIGLDIWGLVAQAEGGGLPIGHGAHLGGSATGIVYFLWLRARFPRTGPL